MVVSELIAVVFASSCVALGGILFARSKRAVKSDSALLEMEAKAAILLTQVTQALPLREQSEVEKQ